MTNKNNLSYVVRFTVLDGNIILEDKTVFLNRRSSKPWTNKIIEELIYNWKKNTYKKPIKIHLLMVCEVCAEIDADVYYSRMQLETQQESDSLIPATDALVDYYVRRFMDPPKDLCFASLEALILNGPQEDGDVLSKISRDDLVRENLAERVVIKGRQGYNAATNLGYLVYKRCLQRKEEKAEVSPT